MRKAVVSVLFAALSLATLFTTKNASAQSVPQLPQNLPSVPGLPASPNANDLSQWLRSSTNGNGGGNSNNNASCATIEIAPGINLPVCSGGLPQPPPGTIIPEILLNPPAFVAQSVDLRAQGLDGPVKHQGQTGVCYAFALSTALEGSLRRQGRPDVLSPLHVVAAGTYYDLWGTKRAEEAITIEGAWPYDPIKACKFERGRDECEQSYGVRTESWRNEPALVAERESARSRGVAFAGKANKIKGDQVQAVVNAVGTGHVLYAEILIDSRAWGFRGIHNGVMEEYDVADRGAHAVALVGYRTTATGRQFLIHNSWGKTWGQDGYAWMSEPSVRKHLRNVWLIDASGGGGGGSLPTPPVVINPQTFPFPIPNLPSTQTQPQNPNPNTNANRSMTCSSGTAIDVGTGKCAPLCRSGLAPFMGQCVFG